MYHEYSPIRSTRSTRRADHPFREKKYNEICSKHNFNLYICIAYDGNVRIKEATFACVMESKLMDRTSWASNRWLDRLVGIHPEKRRHNHRSSSIAVPPPGPSWAEDQEEDMYRGPCHGSYLAS